jgi:hypothetical protein
MFGLKVFEVKLIVRRKYTAVMRFVHVATSGHNRSAFTSQSVNVCFVRAPGGKSFLQRSVVTVVLLSAVSAFGEPLSAEGDLNLGRLHRLEISSASLNAKPIVNDIRLAEVVRVQMRAEGNYLISYFLDEAPSDVSMSTMPGTARDVIVARVSMARKPVYLVKREQSDDTAPPKRLFRSQLKIQQVLSGRAAVGDNLDVTFGAPDGSGKLSIRPLTPNQVKRDYFVVAYVDDDGQRHLAGFSIDEALYRAWEAEVREFNKSVWKPGIVK